MKIAAFKEGDPQEQRISLIPASVKKLTSIGIGVNLPASFGETLGITDDEFKSAGASIFGDEKEMVESSDFAIRIKAPRENDIKSLSSGTIHSSFLDPFNNPKLLDFFNEKKVSSISLEMIPRTTLAQKMDFLSSQANLAGYVAVVNAASRLNKIFPMLMTAAGTISPSRVFIIGAGVAGLQAIATAKRLGARVEAFDTRPVVEEQVQSLGAKFIKVDMGETGQTSGGYAKELTAEQLDLQKQAMAKCVASADVVITTAQLFGRPAPRIVTDEMISQMRPGSVIVDLAVDSGGNVEGSKVGEDVISHGVTIIGGANFAGQVAVHASQMFSNNIVNLVESYWNKDEAKFNLDLNDEIVRGCLMTHDGQIVNEMYKNIVGGA